MGFGINIGNTMEVPGNPTGWGNKFPTEAYIDSVKATGFSTIRIPCAWDSHAADGVINESWMDSVKTVVDMCMRAGLVTILNIHWDGGWLESNLSDDKKDEVVPIAWDTGHEGENNMTIIRRQSEPDGSVFDMDILKIMRSAYGLGEYVNNGITHVEGFDGSGGTTSIATGEHLDEHLGKRVGSLATSGIVREGNRIESAGEIRLFNVNGALVRTAINGMSLENIPHGIYIAKGAGTTLNVNLQ